MKLFESINSQKGITLNSQIVDLLSIIDNTELTQEEQDKRISEYIKSLQDRIDRRKLYFQNFGESFGKSKFLIDEIVDEIQDISGDREKLKQLYLDSAKDLSMLDNEKMKQTLREEGFDENIVDYILRAIKEGEYSVKEGILDMTPEKVRAMHDFMFKNGNRFDFMNVDDAGKYSGCVSFDGKTFAPTRLEKMIEFAKKHNMDTKINTFMFYVDFPQMYEAYCLKNYTTPEMTEEEKRIAIKPHIKATLFNYVENICDSYGEDISAVDILNEVIYDPDMIEPDFKNSEPNTYHQRTGQWMKYLSVDDLAELALTARKKLPNARFVYNDMNWVTPEKRKEIIAFVKKMQEKEAEFRREGKLLPNEKGLIDTIGLEAHLDTGIDINQLETTLEEIEKEIGLPVEITELDIARTGKDPLSQEEIKKQQAILARIQKLANQERNGKPRISAVAMWSQNDDMCFMDEKCKHKVYGSVLNSDFEEKDFEPEKEEILENQRFNYHTHTSLCGHASGEMRDYIEKAIEAGFEKIGFSDHNPTAIGKDNPNNAMSMQQFEQEYLPTLRALREEYADRVQMKIGLEVEYYGDEGEQDPRIKATREKIESELDYMILGQHFAIARDKNGKMLIPPHLSDSKSAQYPLDYANSVVEAMKTGKFAYVAHPDIFLKNRDSVTAEQKEEYDKNAKIATEMICKTATKYKIPLEINLGGIAATRAGITGKGLMKDGSYSYPVPDFWKVAEEMGCDVLIGVDAHDPESLIDRSNEEIAKKIMQDNGINLNYLKDFQPLGIGKELGRISTGKKVLNEVVDLSEDIRDGEITDSAFKIVRKQEDTLNINQGTIK